MANQRLNNCRIIPSAQLPSSFAPKAQPVAPAAAPPAPSGPTPKPIFIRDGKVTNFASPTDLATFARFKALGKSDQYAINHGGDNGIGAPELGTVNTANSYGVALPRDQLRALLGTDPAAYRTARLRMTINNQTINVPIVDYGPSDDQQKKGVVTDATYPLSQAFGGFDMAKATNLGVIRNAGPDYMKDRNAWQQEQDKIHALLNYGTYGEPAPTPH